MQRILLLSCVILAVLTGCAKPAKTTALRPLPDPLLQTQHARHKQMVARAPLYQAPQQPSRPRRYAVQLNERELIPPGGIKRDRWDTIVVHHSANTNDTPESMDDYHRRVRHWQNGLGYHFVIGNGVNTEDGRVYVGSRWKRQITGAHCKSKAGRYFGDWCENNHFNSHGVGICLIGNFEKTRPTAKQLTALRQLAEFLCTHAGIDPARIYGHGDVTHKTLCPGRHLHQQLPQVRAAVAQSLATTLSSD